MNGGSNYSGMRNMQQGMQQMNSMRGGMHMNPMVMNMQNGNRHYNSTNPSNELLAMLQKGGGRSSGQMGAPHNVGAPQFDMNDFPSLGMSNRTSTSSGSSFPNTMNHQVQAQKVEFSVANENFPALGGGGAIKKSRSGSSETEKVKPSLASNSNSTTTSMLDEGMTTGIGSSIQNHMQQQLLMQQHHRRLASSNNSGKSDGLMRPSGLIGHNVNNDGSLDMRGMGAGNVGLEGGAGRRRPHPQDGAQLLQLLQQNRQPQTAHDTRNNVNSNRRESSKNNSNRDAEDTDNSNSSSNQDYGLLGLLSVLRMQNPDMNTLALGTDLTDLGLDLNSPECLYATFASPWANEPSTRQPHFSLPMCYYMQPPHLNLGHFKKFHLETLFYIFYGMPKNILQVYAAEELHSRNWRYHKVHKLWFVQATAQDGVPPSSTGAPQLIFFEISTWERRLFQGRVDDVQKGFLAQSDYVKNTQRNPSSGSNTQ